jgi:hypothetical protein
VPAWLDACQELDAPPPASALTTFLADRCAALVRLALPPVAEGVPAHAN